ncbi:alpha-acetolactate decarboxylase [Ophiobolus disseminans]|uniref:Alpha-acetolactate decarboxylase n=1 Tax=Ophiobolus disseminans TaxID=1469910 RepID=A0A6A7A184_9PLEO|nr:alpha-acetolactate decarboxylase [Ophiobolus disseminans]
MVGSIPNDIFQFSTYAALNAGFNTGQPRTADLTSHGTDGIGSYEDGNLMILIDRQAYAIRKDGTVVPGPQDSRLPFAMVTIFQPTYRVQLPSLSFEGLEDLISSSELGPAKGINTLVPFKISGTFASVALEQGGTRTGVDGTVFGFVVPKWMKDISGPRIHAHFVDESETKGGSVSDFEIEEAVTLGFAKCGRFHLGFPQGPEWEDVKLSSH